MALADGTALYRIRGEGGILLYIGISKHFGRRWKEHAKQQPWWGEMRSLSVDRWFADRGDAEKAEAAAILAEQPKYNKQHVKQPRVRSVRRVRVAAPPSLPKVKRPLPPKVDRLALSRIARLRDSQPAFYEEAEAHRCYVCKAEPGNLCRTKNGNIAYFHVGRGDITGRRSAYSSAPGLPVWSTDACC